MTPIKEKFISTLKSEYPEIKADFDQLIFDNLISPYIVDLPKDVFKNAESIVNSYFELRKNKKYLSSIEEKLISSGVQDPSNYSLLMSYDFHLTPEKELKLIEINTNASFLAMSDVLYKTHSLEQPQKDFKITEIISNIKNELRLQNKNIQTPRIAIMDEAPEQQRLFVEFLVYQNLFTKNGLPCDIIDTQNVKSETFNFDFVYNRFTDFTFANPSSQLFKNLFNERKVCFSPNPYEYLVLADKDLMRTWSQSEKLKEFDIAENHQKSILSSCLQTRDLTSNNKDELWAGRKKLFFKAKNSYGSKQTYRGDGISRSLFDRLVDQNIIAQEYVPAPLVKLGEDDFKYDLRFYAYEGRVQSCIARLYKGQVTNSQTVNGGFAAIRLT